MKQSAPSSCASYLQDAKSDQLYYDVFFEMCRKFHIDWASASEKEKSFITEVTRVTYARRCEPEAPIHPAFSA